MLDGINLTSLAGVLQAHTWWAADFRAGAVILQDGGGARQLTAHPGGRLFRREGRTPGLQGSLSQSLRQNLVSLNCAEVGLPEAAGLGDRWAECGRHLVGFREE